MLDLDRFKHVNDVLGYGSGDRLLAGVADRLQQVVRDGDVVARLGGDEFALLMHDAEVDLAVAVAQRITSAFEQPLLLDDHTVDLSAGLGIAAWPAHAADADALLSRAEVAMYAAKRRTAGAQVYDPAVDTASALNLSLLSELRRAVDQQRAAPVPAAQDRHPRRQRLRRRGAGALAAPHTRPGAADAVHPVCRADRLHPPADAVDLRAGRRRAGGAGACWACAGCR